MPDEFDIQKLLRLKRFEQPNPEYFEGFLREFQQRQRQEMLRQPLWRIAMDRLEAFFGELALPRLAYAGATALVLGIASLASYQILQPVQPQGAFQVAQVGTGTGAEIGAGIQAASSPAGMQVARQVAANAGPVEANGPRTVVQVLNGQRIQLIPMDPMQALQAAQGLQGARTTVPRYVIDSRPVSYEQPSSF